MLAIAAIAAVTVAAARVAGLLAVLAVVFTLGRGVVAVGLRVALGFLAGDAVKAAAGLRVGLRIALRFLAGDAVEAALCVVDVIGCLLATAARGLR